MTPSKGSATPGPMRAPVFVNWGAGTDSTGMIIEMVQRGEPIDLVIFADTKAEKPHTYDFLAIFRAWLAERHIPFEVVTGGAYGTLENRCRTLGTLPSIVMGWKTCSTTYKRDQVDRFITSWAPYQQAKAAGVRCVKVLGYDIGEERRAVTPPKSRYDLRFPLIEWGWDRDRCAEAIASAGLPQPGKSACFFCPSSKKREIVDLAERYPELMARALDMEDRALPNMTSVKGLGRSFSWRDFLAEEKAARCTPELQLNLFAGDETEMPCDCGDGS